MIARGVLRRSFLALALLAAGCSYPNTQVNITDERPAIAVRNAPSGAELMVDGRNLGEAVHYFVGTQVLRLEPGMHVIAVVSSGRTLLNEKVFLGSGGDIRTLTVPEAR